MSGNGNRATDLWQRLSRPVSDQWARRPGAWLALCGGGILVLSYTLVFQLNRDQSIAASFTRAIMNVVPAGMLAILVFRTLERRVLHRAALVQAAAHLVLSFAFSVGWYFSLLVITGVGTDWLERGFQVEPFARVAFVWQMFQGVTLYGLVALFTYALDFQAQAIAARHDLERLRREAAEAPASGAATDRADAPPASLVLRETDEFTVIPHADLVRLSAAGRRTEIVTRAKTYRSATPLARFEGDLPEPTFLRAHRSHIVRLEAVRSAEPAGNGRLTLHLIDGSAVVASRAGARTFRAIAR